MTDSLDLLNNWLAEKRKQGSFFVPENAVPVHITLESSIIPFEPEFLRGLYILEQAMVEKGLDPAAFVIGKNRITDVYTPYSGMMDYLFYDYTISFHGHSYTVRKEGDMAFLEYFSTLCLSDEHEADEHEDIEEPHVKSKSFFLKLIEWLEADAFASYPKPD